MKCRVPSSLGRSDRASGSSGLRRKSSDASVFYRLRREAQESLSTGLSETVDPVGVNSSVGISSGDGTGSGGGGVSDAGAGRSKQGTSVSGSSSAPESLADLVSPFVGFSWQALSRVHHHGDEHEEEACVGKSYARYYLVKTIIAVFYGRRVS